MQLVVLVNITPAAVRCGSIVVSQLPAMNAGTETVSVSALHLQAVMATIPFSKKHLPRLKINKNYRINKFAL
jgi:hypothetical protein